MAKWGKCDFRELKKLQEELNKFQIKEKEEFCKDCAKELAARLLERVTKRTPVGDYAGGEYICKARIGPRLKHKSSKYKGKVGGTLRRGWTAKTEVEAENGENVSIKKYVESLNITRKGSIYEIEIINPMEYASYVEFGHRTKNGKGWVQGHYMLTASEKELKAEAPGKLEKKLEQKLKELFK